jgi:ribosomal protein S27AE
MVKQVKDAKNAPPYDPKSVCSKCGSTEVGTGLCGGGGSCNRFLGTMPWDREAEHIDRTCRRCGYDWWEKPLKEPA